MSVLTGCLQTELVGVCDAEFSSGDFTRVNTIQYTPFSITDLSKL